MNPLFIFVLISVAGIITAQINNPNEQIPNSEWKDTQILFKQGVDITDPSKGVIGVTPDFHQFICDSSIWIDKSKFIEYIWEHVEWRVHIMTAPRRWGKTMNLQMFKFYCELPLNEDGSLMERTESPNYRYFVNGEIVNEDTGEVEYTSKTPLISNYRGNDKHLAKHPVIDMTGIKLDINDDNFRSFRNMIWGVYRSQTKLRNYLTTLSKTDGLNGNDAKENLKLFHMFYDYDSIKAVDWRELADSIQFLSQILFETYNSKVVILYDEHDAFIHYACLENRKFDSHATAVFVGFLKKFMMKTFKDNKFVVKGIITGVLPVQEATGLSGLNNVLSSYIFSRNNMFPYYGVFEKEFDMMADLRKIDDSTRKNVTLYYDGYRILNQLNTPMYSTYSIRGFVNTGEIDDYWQPSTLVDTVTRLFKQSNFLDDISNLMNNNEDDSLISDTSIPYSKLKILNFEDYEQLNTIRLSSSKSEEYDPEKHRYIVFSYLLALGLLTVHPRQSISEGDEVRLRIPNQEIRNHFRNQLLEGLSLTSTGREREALRNYMKKNDDKKTLPDLTKIMSQYLRKTIDHPRFGTLDRSCELLAKAFSHRCYGCEATVEHILFGFLTQTMKMILPLNNPPKNFEGIQIGSQVPWKNDLINCSNYLDIFIMDDDTALIVELKYEDPNHYVKNNAVAAFKQALSYILFYEPYRKNLHPKFIKFLALRIHKTTTIEAISVTFSPADVNSFISTILKPTPKTKSQYDDAINDYYDDHIRAKAFNITYNADTKSHIPEVSTPRPIGKKRRSKQSSKPSSKLPSTQTRLSISSDSTKIKPSPCKPKFTKTSTIEIKVTDSDAAANVETPEPTTTISDTAAVESSTPVQPSPSDVSISTLTYKIGKLSKQLSTTSMKDTPSTTLIKESPTTTSIKDKSATSSIKDTSISEPQTNPSDLTTVTLAQQSISEVFSTEPSKSGSKFTTKSFVMTTITTTPSTTTESTTTETPFFPTLRRHRVSYTRRLRTGSRQTPRTTTISAMQFWKLLLHIR